MTQSAKGQATPLPECGIEGCKNTSESEGLCSTDLRTARVVRYFLASMKVGQIPLVQLLVEVAKPFQPRASGLTDPQGNPL